MPPELRASVEPDMGVTAAGSAPSPPRRWQCPRRSAFAVYLFCILVPTVTFLVLAAPVVAHSLSAATTAIAVILLVLTTLLMALTSFTECACASACALRFALTFCICAPSQPPRAVTLPLAFGASI